MSTINPDQVANSAEHNNAITLDAKQKKAVERQQEVINRRQRVEERAQNEANNPATTDLASQAATQPSGIILEGLRDGEMPPALAQKFDKVLTGASETELNEVLDQATTKDTLKRVCEANDISDKVLDSRVARITKSFAEDITNVTTKLPTDEEIRALAIGEILRERGLTITDRIDLATKDGLNDNAAKEAVRAEVADQIKAEIKNYKGKPEQLVDQIIKLHQEKNFNNGTLEESDLLVLGIKFEDYNEALVGKDINDDNVRADVVRELFKEKYTEALAKKAVANISEDEVQEDIVDSVTKEKKTINRKLTPEEQEARKVLKREVLENFGKVKDAAKLVEAVNDKRNEVVRAALRLGEAEIILRLEGREATNGIAAVEGINKRIKDIEDNPAYQAKKSEFDAAQQAKANYIRTARENGLQIDVNQLAELDQRINQARSDIKTSQDELDLLHLEQDILEEAQQVYKDQNSNDPKVKAEAQADIKAAMTEKDGQPYNPGMVDGYNKVRENAVIKLRELQQDIPNVADKLMTAMEDPQKMKKFMAFLNKEKRNKNLRGLGFILAILGYVFAQPFLEQMGIK